MYQSYDWNFLSLKNELINKKKVCVCVWGGSVSLYSYFFFLVYFSSPFASSQFLFWVSMCICVREGVMFSFNSLVLSVIFYSAVIPQVCPLCPNALLCIYRPHVPLFFVMSSLIVVVASVHQSSCQSVSALL